MIVEMYAGDTVDSLVTHMSALNWVNFDRPITEHIAEARKGYIYAHENFWVTGDSSSRLWRNCIVATLPAGTERVYADLYVIGPSLIGIAYSFVLAPEEQNRLHEALSNDATSEPEINAGRRRIKTVYDQKKERARCAIETIEQRCRDWVKQNFSGTLSNTRESLRAPACALIELAQGKPFASDARYLRVLDLSARPGSYSFNAIDMRFFICYSFEGDFESKITAAYSERDREDSLVRQTMLPEVFHQAVVPLLITEGIYSLLRSYYPALRDIRMDLSRLDLDSAKPAEILALRTRLLKLAPKISTTCREVSLLTDDAIAIWADFRTLEPIHRHQASRRGPKARWSRLVSRRPRSAEQISDPSASAITADTKQRQLREAVVALQSEESNLRELILTTASSKSETVNLELANSLRNLTRWLVTLTILIAVIGGITLYFASETGQSTPSPTKVSSHATPSAKPTVSRQQTKSPSNPAG